MINTTNSRSVINQQKYTGKQKKRKAPMMVKPLRKHTGRKR